VGTGSATISAGATLTIGGGGANGSVVTAVITNNGTLSFNRTDAITFTNAIVGVGAVSKNATGKVIISNANSYAGTTTINVGSVQVASPGALSTNTVITSADASARVLLSSDTTLSNPLTITYKRNDVNFGASVENVSGTNTLAGAMTTLESPFGEVFAVQVDSGKLVVAGSFVNAGPAAHLRTIHLRGGVGDWQGAISNGTAVTAVQMDNAGTWILSGTNNYTGGTTVAGGTLLVNGQLTSAANSVAINNNGTLGGAGIIAGPVTNNAGGTLAPTGVLTINNALSLDGSSTTLMALSTAGGSAKVQGLSSVDMAGTLTVTLAGMPVGGEVFQLIQATAYNGGFWGYTLPTLPPGLSWNYGSLATDGTLRIDGTVIRPTINNLSFSGSSLLISATNGAPWYYFDILSTTNVALPISSWTSEQTAYFDGSGNFDGSITVDPAVPQKFFTIQMHY
jgi:autotransporter-associated beta strand protein